MISYLHKDERLDPHVISTFCHFIHFFADPAAAGEWTAAHTGTFTLSLADATRSPASSTAAASPDVFAA